jgi:hypothetical protein
MLGFISGQFQSFIGGFTHHCFSVTLFTLGFRPFLFWYKKTSVKSRLPIKWPICPLGLLKTDTMTCRSISGKSIFTVLRRIVDNHDHAHSLGWRGIKTHHNITKYIILLTLIQNLNNVIYMRTCNVPTDTLSPWTLNPSCESLHLKNIFGVQNKSAK